MSCHFDFVPFLFFCLFCIMLYCASHIAQTTAKKYICVMIFHCSLLWYVVTVDMVLSDYSCITSLHLPCPLKNILLCTLQTDFQGHQGGIQSHTVTTELFQDKGNHKAHTFRTGRNNTFIPGSCTDCMHVCTES